MPTRTGRSRSGRSGTAPPPYTEISDDEIRETIEANQLRLLKERGADMTIFSPRATTMAHHIGDEAVSQEWTRRCNDLIKRVVDLYPETFIGVAIGVVALIGLTSCGGEDDEEDDDD